jgi:hypothetical protein
MTDRDTRATIRPAALEVDVDAIRKRARGIRQVADQAEAGLVESDRIAQRCLARVIKVLRDEERALDSVAATMEAR